jgi:hypothetical protein
MQTNNGGYVMKSMKKLAAAGALIGIALGAQPMVASAAPELTVQSERAAHPRIIEAIQHMEAALKLLEAAPEDFGGNKAKAIADTRVAIHSLRKALYYRLKMDDAAIDKAQ